MRALVVAATILIGLTVGLAGPIVPTHAQTAPPAPPQAPARPAAPASVDTASYDLDARWDASSSQIHGAATITYRNHSADTLGEVWLKLYLNAFRDPNTPWMREASGAHRGSSYDPRQPGWIRLERLQLLDTGEDLLAGSIDPTATVLRVPLPTARAIGPGETVRFAVAWTSQLPRLFARTGVAGDFVMAGQWYPKLAVYDRGAWDTEPWHANAEFLADFGSYSLTLTVPASHLTGATGTRESLTNNADGTSTIRYWAESVSDMAWTAWPGYRTVTRVVEAAGHAVELELLAPRSMSTRVDQRFFGTARQSLDLLGRWFGPYPWHKLTLVVPPPEASGAEGMEYPMLVTLAQPIPAPFGLERGVRDVEVVTAHEIAHQWVPLQVAPNEAREAWLDEGFADYATTRVLGTIYQPDRSLIDIGPFKLGYEAVHRMQYLMAGVRQPLAQPSWEYDDFLAYGATVYSKGTLVLLTLERTYGEQQFLSAMHSYVDRWRWRHPTTVDFQRSLESDLMTSLDWFFDPLVFGTGVVEYRVADVNDQGAEFERRGDVVFPVTIALTYADGRVEREPWSGEGSRVVLDAHGAALRRAWLDPDQTIRVEPNVLDNGRDVSPSPVPLSTLAARLLGLVQAALFAGMLG
jgi:Peptidase family M1 domain